MKFISPHYKGRVPKKKTDYLVTLIKRVGRYLAEITISWSFEIVTCYWGRWVYWKFLCASRPLVWSCHLIIWFLQDALRGVLIFTVVSDLLLKSSCLRVSFSISIRKDSSGTIWWPIIFVSMSLSISITNIYTLRTNSLVLMLQKIQSQASLRILTKHWTTSWWKLRTQP